MNSTILKTTYRPVWMTEERLAYFGKKVGEDNATAEGIFDAASKILSAGLQTDAKTSYELDRNFDQHVIDILLARLANNTEFARQLAREWIDASESRYSSAELGRANFALSGVMILDATAAILPSKFLAEFKTALYRISESFRIPDIPHGDPHHVINNHWGVAHSAAALAALAALDGSPERDEQYAWAHGRITAYLRQHGESGMYHEGIGYHIYCAAFLLPYVYALKLRGTSNEEIEAFLPGFQKMAQSLYSVSRSDAPHAPKTLSWNDAGSTWCDNCVAILLMALAPETQRGALRTLFDERLGINGDGSFGPRMGGIFFAIAAYPFDVEPQDPNGILPKWVTDSRQGFVVCRSGYSATSESILGGYARCTHPGGHKQDDAGSIRLAAYGHDWIVGGGQNRPDAMWQSIYTATDGVRPSQYACGAIAWAEQTADGGIFGFDLRRSSQAYAERWCAVRFREDSTHLAILDTIDDHTTRDWYWNMSVGEDLEIKINDDMLGFDLIANDGARMHARFLGQQPDAIEIVRMPDSQRTFQGGNVVKYPGLEVIRALFKNKAHRAIFCCAEISKSPTDSKIEFDNSTPGCTIRIHDEEWRNPFGAGISSKYNVMLGGTPSRWPLGVQPKD